MQRFFKRLLAVVLLVSVTGQGCTKALSPETLAAASPVTLRLWAVVDDTDVYKEAIAAFQAQHPNVSFDYRRLRTEEYESELLNAFAEDRGPDIFLIHNTWTNKYAPKIVPMPRTTKTAYRVVVQGLKQEVTWELRSEPTISLKEFKDAFADAISYDLLRNVNLAASGQPQDFQDRPMGVPIGLDTLALYYNKDILNAAAIPTPPETWTQFADQVRKITKRDAQGNIQQSAAAIGTAYNVERSIDILTALMLQNGTEMASASGRPVFQAMPVALQGSREEPPSFQATQFYTDFADPTKDVYTWNANQPASLDAFVQGRTAFFFGYSYQYDTIRSRAPKLNLGLSKLPQIEGNPAKNVANYWYWAVSKKSKNQGVAWRFLNTLTDATISKKILENAKRPAARKSLLNAQLEDERVGVFASQVLNAVSWYKGKDPLAMETAMEQLINDVVTGVRDVKKSVEFAANQVGQTY